LGCNLPLLRLFHGGKAGRGGWLLRINHGSKTIKVSLDSLRGGRIPSCGFQLSIDEFLLPGNTDQDGLVEVWSMYVIRDLTGEGGRMELMDIVAVSSTKLKGRRWLFFRLLCRGDF
jgi:hypothetical protein